MLDQVAKFLDHLTFERGLSPHTREAYETDLRGFVRFLQERYAVTSFSAVTRDQIAAYLADQRTKGFQPATRSRRLVAIKVLFAFLEAERLIPANPAAIIASPAMGRNLPHTLTEAEVRQLLEAIPADGPLNIRDRALLETLYACGLRVSEAVHLSLSDFRSDEGTIRCRGKGNKQRIIPIGRSALAWLQRYLSEVRPRIADRAACGQTLFLSRFGRALTRQAIFLMLEKRARLANIAPHLSPHVLRHCFASHLLAHGAQIRAIQEMLGHANIATTQIYTHVDTLQLQAIHARFHPRH
ncbi:MAG: site-specific tyrosine recombinase XerD [Kiritimatiellae bacterium]|nr:site-specific tyrosine recombinase XerD [Kiritimatiellia bacterium]